MLSEEAMRDRFWRGYPHLRQLLQRHDGSVPRGEDLWGFIDDEPRISIDPGPLGRLADVIAIARLLTSKASEVQNTMRGGASSAESIAEEVRQLLDELEGRLDGFQHAVAAACRRQLESTRTTARDLQELRHHLAHDRAKSRE
jgi:hypothetical protein